jgi:hypothetical protein
MVGNFACLIIDTNDLVGVNVLDDGFPGKRKPRVPITVVQTIHEHLQA